MNRPPASPSRRKPAPLSSYTPVAVATSPPQTPSRHQRFHSIASSDQSHTGFMPPSSQEEHAVLVKRARRSDDETTEGVATHAIGGGYGPFAYEPAASQYNPARFSNMSNASGFTEKSGSVSGPPTPNSPAPVEPQQPPPPPRRTNTVGLLMDKEDQEVDDILHNPDPIRDAMLDRKWTLFSLRGWLNIGMLVVILFGLITLFAGYPIAQWYMVHHPRGGGYNIGGINGTGQIPILNIPRLVDIDTPREAYKRKGFDGHDYELVFSDEFNVNGRSFYEGDDPYWEAVNLHYWLTGDLEWYRQDAITTKDGNLVITLTEEPINDLHWKSGMLQSWNKFCFTTGYIEVNMSLPGDARVPGFWPAAWTLGNLGRIGHGATTDGLWPFSYDTCDVGTYPNQTRKDGTPNSGTTSYTPGQRLSACTCEGQDHPGPRVNVGRGAPEIDIIEAEVNLKSWQGSASQSLQLAPFNAAYIPNDAGSIIHNSTNTHINQYRGGRYQQAVSALTDIGRWAYNGTGYSTYGFEYWSDPKDRDAGFVTWQADGKPTWTATAATIRGDPVTNIGPRIISEEPMSIALNLGLAPSFQAQDFKNLVFPARMYVDYVRVYQRKGFTNIGCDPKAYPTAKYIERHIEAYTNPNLTTWEQAGNAFPRNSDYDGC